MRSNTAAIFDLDGTLLDTITDLARCVNTALESHGFPTHGEDKYKIFVGNGSAELIRRALPDGVAQADFRAVYDEYFGLYGELWHEKTAPYAGILELLEELSRLGAALAVVSNKPHERAVEVIDYFFPGRFSLVCGQRPDLPLKPDPTGLLMAVRELGVPPENVFYIGDTGVDVETGKRAGVFTAGALWGFRDRAELTAAGADIICETPRDALRVFLEKF